MVCEVKLYSLCEVQSVIRLQDTVSLHIVVTSFRFHPVVVCSLVYCIIGVQQRAVALAVMSSIILVTSLSHLVGTQRFSRRQLIVSPLINGILLLVSLRRLTGRPDCKRTKIVHGVQMMNQSCLSRIQVKLPQAASFVGRNVNTINGINLFNTVCLADFVIQIVMRLMYLYVHWSFCGQVPCYFADVYCREWTSPSPFCRL